MNLTELTEIFNDAIEFNVKYVAVKIKFDWLSKHEIIINERENFEEKLRYYQNTYDFYCVHKGNSGIRIVDCTYANKYSEIEEQFAD